ncbi:hypothetical protein [Pandoravirus japonicus]|uniref:Uncharacterized protein n=1 Tax=Pandoravirus japonicus TaxID=2823154 RepID=A0A811BSM9_9VIRU|nr:hypothetical protein [Pandoravirus japonicus]
MKNPDNDLETCTNQIRFVDSDCGASADPNASASATKSCWHSCLGSGRNGWFYPAIFVFVPILCRLLTRGLIPTGTDQSHS